MPSNFFDAPVGKFAHLGGKGTRRAFQHRLFGNDVVLRAGPCLAHADDDGIHRIGAARDDALQRHHDLTCNIKCINAQIGLGDVRAFSLDVDAEEVAARIDGTCDARDLSDIKRAGHMSAEDSVDALKKAGSYKLPRSLPDFLSLLEKEPHFS